MEREARTPPTAIVAPTHALDASGLTYGALRRYQDASLPEDLDEPVDSDGKLGVHHRPLAAKSTGGTLAFTDLGVRVEHSADRMRQELKLSRTPQFIRIGRDARGIVSGGRSPSVALVGGRANERLQGGLDDISPKQDGGTDLRIGTGIVEGSTAVYASCRIESHFEVSTFTFNVRTMRLHA